ncbi:hypothetical protein [Mycetocola zhujimingii]|uniref:Uncharacterized protein n=1 Tax=Mycetocola zhujimingii TaxID=2079792 RepID=A0A2U1TCB8_9MICO|nr:hypothetical protein [Mycetocola zhujimingii]PWC06423.1 hypothetical protein DF223_12585 [Mycetocola zhujimingii]
MQPELALDWTSTVLAGIALILSIIVARYALSQTQTLHHESHTVALEEYERTRFDKLFDANETLLNSIADFKAELLPYWKETDESLSRKTDDLTMLPYEVTVHKSMEHFFAARLGLDIALATLPTFDGNSSNDSDETRTSHLGVQLSAAWLGGCVMATYLSLVNRVVKEGDSQTGTDQAVFSAIQNNMDWDVFPSADKRRSYFKEAAKSWSAGRATEVAEGAQIGTPSPNQPTELILTDTANTAYAFLQAAERQLVQDTKELLVAYTARREAAAASTLQARRNSRWIRTKQYS